MVISIYRIESHSVNRKDVKQYYWSTNLLELLSADAQVSTVFEPVNGELMYALAK
ncbi:MAG: hypothetical protein ACK45I_03135 [Bacteroidota bacterium]|jgi:hypothetical protein